MPGSGRCDRCAQTASAPFRLRWLPACHWCRCWSGWKIPPPRATATGRTVRTESWYFQTSAIRFAWRSRRFQPAVPPCHARRPARNAHLRCDRMAASGTADHWRQKTDCRWSHRWQPAGWTCRYPLRFCCKPTSTARLPALTGMGFSWFSSKLWAQKALEHTQSGGGFL